MGNKRLAFIWCSFCTLISITFIVSGFILLSKEFDPKLICIQEFQDECEQGNFELCFCDDNNFIVLIENCDVNALIDKTSERDSWGLTNYFGDSLGCQCKNSSTCIDISSEILYERLIRLLLIIMPCFFPVLGLCIALFFC